MHTLFVITTADREDPDYILHNVAFHQGLHCLLRKNNLQRKELQFYLEIITCDPLNYTIDHSKLIASTQKEELISSFKSTSTAKSELHLYNETPIYLVNFVLLSLHTEMYLQQIMQVSC